MDYDNKPTPEQSDDRTKVTIGNTDFYVSVHFGSIPLDEILRRRILGDFQQAS
jgi:hypothetical protein